MDKWLYHSPTKRASQAPQHAESTSTYVSKDQHKTDISVHQAVAETRHKMKEQLNEYSSHEIPRSKNLQHISHSKK